MKREEKKALTRQRIAEAAKELFEQSGYEAATVQQIADRASIAKGTFFNYFTSKEDLMLELQGMTIIREIENLAGKPGPVIPRIQALLFEYARHFPMNRTVTRAVMQGMFGSEKLREAQIDRCVELGNGLAPVLELAQARGEIRSDIPASVVAQLAIQTYYGVLMSWALEQGEAELADQMMLTFEVFVRGISP
ncbi:TetR/AcrR family transcriptional regulator [Cohnella caldifontis]|uniref:TetR/AcrR family transcriptional regulator n=1 Tax=Cohnella caldifontis TaxID=3027471 RepID=UPI0023EC06F0|nr:TetR/AcrR family transcriptional regulator [Cohnella sp. YIM B05605]